MYSVQTLLDVDQVPHGVSRPTVKHRAPAAGHTLEHRELNYKPKRTKLCKKVLHTVVRSYNFNYGPHRKTVFFSQNLISRKIKLL